MSNCVAQSVASLTADTEIASWSHSLVEIDHEIIYTVILLSSADSRRVVVISKRRYVHKVLAYCLVKLAQEKSEAR